VCSRRRPKYNRAYVSPVPSQFFPSLFGRNLVSIERRHQGASFGAIPIVIEEELNIFEGILSLKGSQPPRAPFVLVFCKIYPLPLVTW
jgi:hypothetical protein